MIVRHSLFYALARGVPGLVSLATIAVFTRLLPTDVYGRYAMVLAGTGLAGAVLFQWLQFGLLRFLPAERDRPEVLLSTVAVFFLAMVVLGGASGIGLGLTVSGPWPLLMVIGTVLMWGQAWFALNLELARLAMKPGRYGALSATRAVLALVLGTGAILAGLGAAGPLAGMLGAIVVTSALLSDPAWRQVRPGRTDLALARRIAAYGLPLSATSLLEFAIVAGDRFLLAWLIGSEATGAYAAAFDLVLFAIGGLMVIVNLAGYPLAVRAFEEEGVEAARVQLRANALLLLAVAVPAATGIAVAAPAIASVMLGEAFRATGVRLLPLAAVAAVLSGYLAYHLGLAFQLGRRTMGQMAVSGLGSAANVALNLLLIPRFGVMGAIWASASSYALACVVGWRLGRRHFPLPVLPAEAWKVAAAAALMAAALWPLRPIIGVAGLALHIGTGALVYALAAFALDLAGVRSNGPRAVLRGT